MTLGYFMRSYWARMPVCTKGESSYKKVDSKIVVKVTWRRGTCPSLFPGEAKSIHRCVPKEEDVEEGGRRKKSRQKAGCLLMESMGVPRVPRKVKRQWSTATYNKENSNLCSEQKLLSQKVKKPQHTWRLRRMKMMIQDLIHDARGHDVNQEYWKVGLVNLHWQDKYWNSPRRLDPEESTMEFFF